MPLTLVTAVSAGSPFEGAPEAERWLRRVRESEREAEEWVGWAFSLLDRAVATDAAATGRPYAAGARPERVPAVRIGYGTGEQVADGRYGEAIEIDVGGGGGSRRRMRAESVRPLARIAAVLGGRERLDACETLLPRVRADLDGGRLREAALGIEVAARAVVAELDGALEDPDHDADVEALGAMLDDLAVLTRSALDEREPWAGLAADLEQPLALAERILRRRRVLRP